MEEVFLLIHSYFYQKSIKPLNTTHSVMFTTGVTNKRFSSKSFFKIGPVQQLVQSELSISSLVGRFFKIFLFSHQILKLLLSSS